MVVGLHGVKYAVHCIHGFKAAERSIVGPWYTYADSLPARSSSILLRPCHQVGLCSVDSVSVSKAPRQLGPMATRSSEKSKVWSLCTKRSA